MSSEGVLTDAKEICETNTTHDFDGEGPHILTSPIYIEDAQPGDVLKVEILDLVPRVPYGVISNRHYKGTLVGEFPENEGRLEGADAAHYEKYNDVSVYAPIKKVDGQYYCYLNQGNKDLEFPIKPFLGTMGVVSATESHLSSVPPSALGGNIDINELGTGSTLYLPVEVAGGLFYTGDPHFVQGDGEVALTALEGSLRATLRFTVLKKGSKEIPGDGEHFNQAFGETEDYWIPVGLNEDLDEAMKQSVRESIDFINEQFGIERKMAYAYLSAATDYEVSQVVDKVKGIHAIINKANFIDYISLKLQVGSQTLSGEFINEKPYVNADKVAAALGASINYDAQKIEITYNKRTYIMAIDSNVYTTPDKKVTLTTSPVRYKNQVMLPTSVLKEVLGMGLNWSTQGKDIVGTVSPL